MSETNIAESDSIHGGTTEDEPVKPVRSEGGEKNIYAATSDFIKANPWIAVSGAAVIGGVVVALLRPTRPKVKTPDSVRDWFQEARAKLPLQDNIHSSIGSSSIAKLLGYLKKASRYIS